MDNVRGNLLFTGFLLCSLLAFSQEIRIKGAFVEEGMKLGQPVHYWLSASYPQEFDMVLPDSLHDFSPFEFYDKTYYPSKLKNGRITDSAVYVLQSYEIDPVQKLSLTGYLLKGGDTTKITAPLDSILFMALVPQVTDTTKLKTNLAYQDVNQQFNYPLMAIILVVLGVVCIVFILIYGKKVQRWWKVRQLKKAYLLFSDRLTAYIRLLQNEPERHVAESAISDWKKFLEKLEQLPYTKLTTKEIMTLTHAQELKDSLKQIDQSIYGRHMDESIYKHFQAVEDYTQHRYGHIIDEIKHSKK